MNEKLVRECLRMFRERAAYYEHTVWSSDMSRIEMDVFSQSFQDAADMLENAIEDNAERLVSFDCFGEDK